MTWARVRHDLKYHVSGWELPGVRQCCALHTRAAMLPSLLRHQTHTEPSGRLADRADAVLLIDQDLPDLLRVAVAAFGLQAGASV